MSNETVTIPAEMWKNSLVKIDELKAENERLREAGAAMYDTAVQDSMGLWLMPAFKRWSKIENEKESK